MKLLHAILLQCFLILIGIIWVKPAFGQAEVHFYSGEIVSGEIVEETDEQISLKMANDSTEEVLILDKAQIRLIYFENGDVIRFNRKPLGNLFRRYADRFEKPIPYQQEVFISPLSVLTNHIELGYERRLRDGFGLEISLGLIGAGLGERQGEMHIDDLKLITLSNGEQVENGIQAFAEGENGFLVKVAPKIMIKAKNSLEGLYVKPELSYHRFTNSGSGYRRFRSEPQNDYDFSWKFAGGSAAMIFKLGLQKIILKRLTFDYNVGLGFGKDFFDLMTEGDYASYKGGIPFRYVDFRRDVERYTHTKVNIADIDMLFNHEFSIGFIF